MAKIWKTEFSQALQLWQHHFSPKLGLKAVFKILKENCPEYICAIYSLFPLLASQSERWHEACQCLGISKAGGGSHCSLLTVQLSQMQQQLIKHTLFPHSTRSGCKINFHNKNIEPVQCLTPRWNSQERARFCEDHQEEASCHAWCSDAGRAVLASSVA